MWEPSVGTGALSTPRSGPGRQISPLRKECRAYRPRSPRRPSVSRRVPPARLARHESEMITPNEDRSTAGLARGVGPIVAPNRTPTIPRANAMSLPAFTVAPETAGELRRPPSRSISTPAGGLALTSVRPPWPNGTGLIFRDRRRSPRWLWSGRTIRTGQAMFGPRGSFRPAAVRARRRRRTPAGPSVWLTKPNHARPIGVAGQGARAFAQACRMTLGRRRRSGAAVVGIERSGHRGVGRRTGLPETSWMAAGGGLFARPPGDRPCCRLATDAGERSSTDPALLSIQCCRAGVACAVWTGAVTGARRDHCQGVAPQSGRQGWKCRADTGFGSDLSRDCGDHPGHRSEILPSWRTVTVGAGSVDIVGPRCGAVMGHPALKSPSWGIGSVSV